MLAKNIHDSTYTVIIDDIDSEYFRRGYVKIPGYLKMFFNNMNYIHKEQLIALKEFINGSTEE